MLTILVQNEHLHLTIYETAKVRHIGNKLYFVCDANSESYGKRYLMPLQIQFLTGGDAHAALLQLYKDHSIDLSDRVATPIATLKELKMMSNKELLAYFKKFVN